ncbi:hypothetical protein ACH6CV_13115 [Bacillota bacterium Meth-B3]
MSNLETEILIQDPLIGELERTLDQLVVYRGDPRQVDFRNLKTLLVSFRNAGTMSNLCALKLLLAEALRLGKTLILLHVEEGNQLAQLLGVGMNCRCMIVKPYPDFKVVHVLGQHDCPISFGGQCQITQCEDGCKRACVESPGLNECGAYRSGGHCESYAVEARKIESILESNFVMPEAFCSAGSSPADLPREQFNITYLAIEEIRNLSDLQVTNNSVVMEISLIASYNPQYKYLRIRSVGAGFNPANGGAMQSDSTYDRGYFQEEIKIHMQPMSSSLRTLTTEPKNINRQQQYTTSSQFSVGVDVAKNPSFNSSYTISESMTTVVSDFNIYNNSAGVTGEWEFQLAMTENSIWDIFDEQTLKKAKVKSLPPLATKNLQAVTESVWYGANTLNGVIGMQLYWHINHFHCWVTGDWASYTKHYHRIGATRGYVDDNLIYLDFSSVNA